MSAMQEPIVVTHEGGDRLRIAPRGHELWSDQPVADGGGDSALTPTEIFVAGIAACVAYYAERFLRRHDMSTDGLRVTARYGWAENPHRVGEIDLEVEAPRLAPARQEAFERVIERCTLHSTLRQPPAVRIRLRRADTAAA